MWKFLFLKLNLLKITDFRIPLLPFCRRIKIADFDFSKKCRQIAADTEGLSGREIAKLGVAWQVLNKCSKFNLSSKL